MCPRLSANYVSCCPPNMAQVSVWAGNLQLYINSKNFVILRQITLILAGAVLYSLQKEDIQTLCYFLHTAFDFTACISTLQF